MQVGFLDLSAIKLSSETLRREAWKILSDVSEELTASIVIVMRDRVKCP
jgi:hypothetical protein